jgi:hypothetical protein
MGAQVLSNPNWSSLSGADTTEEEDMQCVYIALHSGQLHGTSVIWYSSELHAVLGENDHVPRYTHSFRFCLLGLLVKAPSFRLTKRFSTCLHNRHASWDVLGFAWEAHGHHMI